MKSERRRLSWSTPAAVLFALSPGILGGWGLVSLNPVAAGANNDHTLVLTPHVAASSGRAALNPHALSAVPDFAQLPFDQITVTSGAHVDPRLSRLDAGGRSFRQELAGVSSRSEPRVYRREPRWSPLRDWRQWRVQSVDKQETHACSKSLARGGWRCGPHTSVKPDVLVHAGTSLGAMSIDSIGPGQSLNIDIPASARARRHLRPELISPSGRLVTLGISVDDGEPISWSCASRCPLPENAWNTLRNLAPEGAGNAIKNSPSVIPANAGIEENPSNPALLDPRVRGHDGEHNVPTPRLRAKGIRLHVVGPQPTLAITWHGHGGQVPSLSSPQQPPDDHP